ncbi:MAG: heavy-metal-associated domain-containing protein [Bdellovibrionaceae bacterium]|nr:heavy-metal-associated domain-containing protein [Pseudobdellovibrionaceae bacterium]
MQKQKIKLSRILPWGLLAWLGMVTSLAQAEVQELKVKGMVCSFCAQGIEKKIKQHSGVKQVQVDLKAKTVKVDWGDNPSTLQENDYRHLLEEAGYELDSLRVLGGG